LNPKKGGSSLNMNPKPAANVKACTLVWLRRDLRLEDHAAIAKALSFNEPLVLVFVFDQEILNKIPKTPGQKLNQDRRVAFIHAAVSEIAGRLSSAGAHLLVRYGKASEIIPTLAQSIGACRVVFAHDDEPAARVRDRQVTLSLAGLGIEGLSVKDQCIFERNEILTATGKPYSVFTPYKNTWLKHLTSEIIASHASGAGISRPHDKTIGKDLAQRLLPAKSLGDQNLQAIPGLESMGFGPGNLAQLQIPLGESGAQELLKDFLPRMGKYNLARDFPAIKGPSYLSVHLRFGTVSIRSLVRHAQAIQQNKTDHEGAATWLSELIWRDFYMQILFHHPHVVSKSFRPEYDQIQWETGPESDVMFEAWCEGMTGFPLVDAAMRQLNATGYMHNRLRMVVASFLTKDLGISWQRGEAYFAWKLNDFDLSANNGGWQWAASSGCDAQPYFRIFNPVSQSERFDAKGVFIRRYVPEVAGLPDKYIHAPWACPPLVLNDAGITLGKDYPLPLVAHDQAREKTLRRYKEALGRAV
jgi:deoxyribodipyrimidine photo-lyase